jgi:hypothetical protein
MNLTWLRRLKLTAGPAITKDETSKYTIVLKNERAWQFVFPIEVKSFITRPSPRLVLRGPGFYEISGLASSGNGSIRPVEVSADGVRSWPQAALQGPILPKAPVRFRAAWQWNGGPPCCRVAPLTAQAWCSQRVLGPSKVSVGSGALATHVARCELAADGPLRERYLVGPLDTSDESAWRAEIGWPIVKVAERPD